MDENLRIEEKHIVEIVTRKLKYTWFLATIVVALSAPYLTTTVIAYAQSQVNQSSSAGEQPSLTNNTNTGLNSINVRNILSDYTTIVSFLIGVSTFILGLRFSNLMTRTGEKSYTMIVWALTIACAILIGLGMSYIVMFSLYASHLVQFVVLMAPVVVLLYINWRPPK